MSASPEQSAASSSRGRGLGGASSGSGALSKRGAAQSSSSSRPALGDITNKDRQPAASTQLRKEKTAPAARQTAAAAPPLSLSAAAASSPSPLPCPDIEHTLGLTFAEQCAREAEEESDWVQAGELTTAECEAVVRQLTSQSSLRRMFETEDDRFMPYPTIDAGQGTEDGAEAADLQQVEQLQLELNLNFDLGF